MRFNDIIIITIIYNGVNFNDIIIYNNVKSNPNQVVHLCQVI
jgi:hypothetical protein